MLKQFQYWCFDLDGVLVDLKNRYIAVYHYLVKDLGGRPVEEYWEKRRLGKTESELFAESGLPKNLLGVYDQRRERLLEENNYLKLDHVFPGVYLLLEYLQKSNAKSWIITHRRCAESLSAQLDSLGLNKLITGWIHTNKNCDSKNELLQLSDAGIRFASDAKAIVLKQIKQKGATVMLGDSPSDINAAHQAEVGSIALPTGLHNSEILLKSDPNYLFESIEDVLQHIID